MIRPLTLTDWKNRIAKINTDNGWRETRPAADSAAANTNWQITQIALIITEAAEAIEELRDGHAANETYYSKRTVNGAGKPEGVPSELADIVIRALDCADLFGIDIEAIIDEKLDFNQSRGYRHGGKVA